MNLVLHYITVPLLDKEYRHGDEVDVWFTEANREWSARGMIVSSHSSPPTLVIRNRVLVGEPEDDYYLYRIIPIAMITRVELIPFG
ncbi:hypothetical protein GZH47_33010 (plasmid) [Paenibacillus rhizovicinus]|uniref:Uncharacterized protein n=1 Tax=Paenibacillus rhizovicinus TaxID=2704463 RepID=A0A6C0PBI0_9BACL|nr:hypothetical protein [Paenibacillus rhizovicinus]QHW35715.1 hypothetical protein GZH47_33010 [Paenibacillus rhizovicinus]